MELELFAGNIVLALVLGALIGLEREFRHRPAGLRTNALVSIGAALFASGSRLMGPDTSATRIAAGIVVGIGFLGGGVILKEGMTIRGLTTAAGVWCAAAVGTLTGAGLGLHAAIGTGLILVVLVVLKPLDVWVGRLHDRFGAHESHYRVKVACTAEAVAAAQAALDRLAGAHPGTTLCGTTVRVQKARHRAVLVAEVHTTSAGDAVVEQIVSQLLGEPGVTAASWTKVATEWGS